MFNSSFCRRSRSACSSFDAPRSTLPLVGRGRRRSVSPSKSTAASPISAMTRRHTQNFSGRMGARSGSSEREKTIGAFSQRHATAKSARRG